MPLVAVSTSADYATSRGKAWLVVGLLWVVGCLNYLDRLTITTMRDSIKEAIPMGDEDFGYIFMGAALMMLVSGLALALVKPSQRN
jgi:hypothetical protein